MLEMIRMIGNISLSASAESGLLREYVKRQRAVHYLTHDKAALVKMEVR